MMNNTTNLNLIKPDLDTEIHQTIADLASNFQKIDDVADIYGSGMPISGDWLVPRIRWELSPVAGGKMGWVTIRSGKAARAWSALNPFVLGDLIVPTLNNGHYYQCIQKGMSAVTEPTFPTTSGAIIEDIKGASVWQVTKSYALNTIVKPSLSNDRYYICKNSGVSGITEPTWLTSEGSITSDNGVQWTCHIIAKWQEMGTSALFKQFGLIDM
ncbi:hypothetical protein BC351_10280 [Paenibacillus ferrarius]|uniref:Uncharacterized protein n=1 Tax=Paenibacillus ferrarius TaxID=1469647 RepID=A0A1V4H8U7_9BACL|nr:hypothetical protein [Paenibacillus ferrarius]OPH47571.1 hypothetical protein BC351_10280 [Paenibacillus ferrarius]